MCQTTVVTARYLATSLVSQSLWLLLAFSTLSISILLVISLHCQRDHTNDVPVRMNSSTNGAVEFLLTSRLHSENLIIVPPEKNLSHGLDMTAVMPFDIESVGSSLQGLKMACLPC